MTGRHSSIAVRRVYDEPSAVDGCRVLVDRLWPRGMRKSDLPHDEWCREVAPSTPLRRWYGHDRDKFPEFRRRYRRELAEPEPAAALEYLRELSCRGGLTLLTATKDVDVSAAEVLADMLRHHGDRPASPGPA